MPGLADEHELSRLFAAEAGELLGTIAQGALELEETEAGGEHMTTLFRAAHTLKGAAAVVGYEPVRGVAHRLEDLFDDLRAGRREPDRTTIDAILACADALRAAVGALACGEPGEREAATARQALEAALAAPPPAPAAAADPPPPPAAASAAVSPEGAYVRMPVERADAITSLANEAITAGLGVERELARREPDDPDALAPYEELDRALGALRREALKARMTTFGTVAGPLQRAVRDIAAHEGKRVAWSLHGEAVELDRRVLEALREPLLHLVRNAVAHGVETPTDRIAAGKPEQGVVRVAAEARGSEVRITVRDDGRGIDVDAIRAGSEQAGAAAEPLELIFRPGFSTARQVSDAAGRGVGLDVVQAVTEAVRGRIEVDTQRGRGTEFAISVPLTLAVLPCIVAVAGGQRFAIPLHAAETIVDTDPADEEAVEGRRALRVDCGLVEVRSLATALGRPDGATGPALVVASGAARCAFRVDELVDRRDVVVKDLGGVLPRIDVLAGAAVEPDGSLMLVLDPAGLVARGLASPTAAGVRAGAVAAPARERRVRVLVVDDAMTVRELQRSILERAGYEVLTAVDGADALGRLAAADVDLVLTDIDMPRLDGFSLIETIRARPQLADLPVIVITAQEDERDRRRGLEVGADSYIVKRAFEEQALLDAVERVLGKER